MSRLVLTKVSIFLTRKAIFFGIIIISVTFIIALTIIGSNTDDPATIKATNATTVGLGLLIGFLAVIPYLAEKFLATRKLSDAEVHNAKSKLAQAQFHFERQEYAPAIDSASIVIEILPKKAEAYRIRAQAHEGLGQLASALSDWSRAINLEPGYPFGYSFRASIYKEMGEHEKAIADFTTALVLTPDVSGNLYQVAQEYFLVGKFAEAKSLFEKVLADPNTSSKEKSMAEDHLKRMPLVNQT